MEIHLYIYKASILPEGGTGVKYQESRCYGEQEPTEKMCFSPSTKFNNLVDQISFGCKWKFWFNGGRKNVLGQKM